MPAVYFSTDPFAFLHLKASVIKIQLLNTVCIIGFKYRIFQLLIMCILRIVAVAFFYNIRFYGTFKSNFGGYRIYMVCKSLRGPGHHNKQYQPKAN